MNDSFYEKELTEKPLDKKIIIRLLKYIKPYRFLLAMTVFLLFLSAGLQILGPYLIKVAIDNYIIPGKVDGLLNIVLIYGLAILFEFVIRYLQGYYTE